MRKLLLSALLLLTACQGSQVPQELVTSKDTAEVVGGVTVPYTNELTNMALSLRIAEKLKDNSYSIFQCGASALSSRVILTAAHCVGSRAEYTQVELRTKKGEIVPIKVVSAYVHADYPEDSQSDLALMVLAQDLPSSIKRLSIPFTASSINFSKILAAGYGRKTGVRGQDGEINILRAAELSVTDLREGSKVFHVDQTDGKGICQGDSGGPAIVRLNQRTFVMGVVSKTRFNYPKDPHQAVDQCNFLGEYVNLQYPPFKQWIYQVIVTLASRKPVPAELAKTYHLQK